MQHRESLFPRTDGVSGSSAGPPSLIIRALEISVRDRVITPPNWYNRTLSDAVRHFRASRNRFDPATCQDATPATSMVRGTTPMNDPQFERLLSKLELARRQHAELLDLLLDVPGAAASGGDNHDWSGPLRDWWSQNRSSADAEAAGVFEKLVAHGRILFDLSQRLDDVHRGGRGGKAHREIPVLLEQFQRSLFGILNGRDTDDFSHFSPMGHLVGLWRHHVEGLFGMSGAPLTAFSESGRPLDAHRLREMLGTSNQGFAAPKMDRSALMDMMDAIVDHQQAFNRFARLLAQAAVEAVSRMEASIAPEKNAKPRGARDLYADWLDCCESVYDEIARDEDFADSLCQLVNSAVRVSAARRTVAIHAASTMDLPSLTVGRELARSLQDARRRLRRLERARPADAPSGSSFETAVEPAASSRPETGGEAGEPSDPSRHRHKTKTKRVVKKRTSGKKTARKKKAAGAENRPTRNP